METLLINYLHSVSRRSKTAWSAGLGSRSLSECSTAARSSSASWLAHLLPQPILAPVSPPLDYSYTRMLFNSSRSSRRSRSRAATTRTRGRRRPSCRTCCPTWRPPALRCSLRLSHGRPPPPFPSWLSHTEAKFQPLQAAGQPSRRTLISRRSYNSSPPSSGYFNWVLLYLSTSRHSSLDQFVIV